MSSIDSSRSAWALKLYACSPLKQRKFRMLTEFLGGCHGRECLDLGSDNGVISLLLREQGGRWSSADLLPETVASIEALVGERVSLTDGMTLPYPTEAFDRVAVVDMLEHVADDRGCATELARVLKAGGILVVNVPSPKEGWVRRFRYFLGQTDAAHGHVRAGYDEAGLKALFGNEFEIEAARRYGRVFSELFDTVITAALDRLKRGGRGKKGTVVTGADLRKLKKSYALYRILYPFFALVVSLDALVPMCHGNMLIMRLRKR